MINFNTILSRSNGMNIFFVFRRHMRFIVAIIIILAVSTDVLSSNEIEVGIGEAARSLDEARSSVLSLDKNLMLQQQNLSQLNRQIEEIEKAYPKPRSKDVENTLFEFENVRDAAKQSVDEQSVKMAKPRERVKGLERELNDLRLKQIQSGKSKSVFKITVPEEDKPKAGAYESAQVKIHDIRKQTKDDLENSKDASSSYRERVRNFRKKVKEISREANERMDITYDKMLASYYTMKSQGLVIWGGAPKKPEGYDQRMLERRKRSASGGISGQQSIYVAPKHASEKSNAQQRIDDLREQIKNTNDPQEKANLEQLLKDLEST